MNKDLITIKDLGPKEIENLFLSAKKIKQRPKAFSKAFPGKTLGLIFQKPSNRTRVSFEVGMRQFGGNVIYLSPEDIQLGVREAIKDIALTLSRYIDIIVARTFSHSDVLELSKYAAIPVINGLSDMHHPCQALADIFTVQEKFRKIKGLKLCYIGDGNNVLHSLLQTAAMTGLNTSFVTPKGYEPDAQILSEAVNMARSTGAVIEAARTKEEGAKDADILYTDTWVSMGQEFEKEKRMADFKDFQINSAVLKYAKPGCIVMHCLPAHRGQEITDDVIDGPHSAVFDQAENRLHMQKAVLLKLLKR